MIDRLDDKESINSFCSPPSSLRARVCIGTSLRNKNPLGPTSLITLINSYSAAWTTEWREEKQLGKTEDSGGGVVLMSNGDEM